MIAETKQTWGQPYPATPRFHCSLPVVLILRVGIVARLRILLILRVGIVVRLRILLIRGGRGGAVRVGSPISVLIVGAVGAALRRRSRGPGGKGGIGRIAGIWGVSGSVGISRVVIIAGIVG